MCELLEVTGFTWLATVHIVRADIYTLYAHDHINPSCQQSSWEIVSLFMLPMSSFFYAGVHLYTLFFLRFSVYQKFGRNISTHVLQKL
jgi:hypothetical protein